MREDELQESGTEHMIRTPEDFAAALTAQFLTNAENGDHVANDDMITHLCAWKRRNTP